MKSNMKKMRRMKQNLGGRHGDASAGESGENGCCGGLGYEWPHISALAVP